MAETINIHDFIEIDYTGKIAGGKIFDTTDAKVAQETGLQQKQIKYTPFQLCVGEEQILPGLDKELVGKEVGKSYIISLNPEDAFGKRDVKKVQLVPIAAFQEHNMKPHPGMQVDFDGRIGTIMRVAGGRVMVNFNHPLAGREVEYEVKILRKITDPAEKISSYLGNIFRQVKNLGKIEVKDEEATVKLPFELPEQFRTHLEGHLGKLVGLKKLAFAVDKSIAGGADLAKVAEEASAGHVHGPNCNHEH